MNSDQTSCPPAPRSNSPPSGVLRAAFGPGANRGLLLVDVLRVSARRPAFGTFSLRQISGLSGSEVAPLAGQPPRRRELCLLRRLRCRSPIVAVGRPAGLRISRFVSTVQALVGCRVRRGCANALVHPRLRRSSARGPPPLDRIGSAWVSWRAGGGTPRANLELGSEERKGPRPSERSFRVPVPSRGVYCLSQAWTRRPLAASSMRSMRSFSIPQ
jgi:hypothetical protein